MARQEFVVLKGGRDGVAVIIDERAPIEHAVSELRRKLVEAGGFFRGAVFSLEAGKRSLTPEERDALSTAVGEFGIHLKESEAIPSAAPARAVSQADSASDSEASASAPERTGRDEATLLVRRTLRSGQRIDYDGNVVVMGDVNAGAVVVCTGDIVVLGTLRGLAHAGAQGNADAIVMAFRLEPTQLRIGPYISRAPDGGARPEGPEVARVKNDVIQVEAYAC